MNQYQRDVRAFHKATGGTIGETIGLNDAWLGANLIAEEAAETISALGFRVKIEVARSVYSGDGIHLERNNYDKLAHADLENAIKELCDLIYVSIGRAVTMGIDLDPFWSEGQRANMAKATGPKRDDGKQLKPDGWRPPDIAGILQQMLWSELDYDNVADYPADWGGSWS